MKKSVLAVLVLGASLAVTGCFDKQETAQKVEAAKMQQQMQQHKLKMQQKKLQLMLKMRQLTQRFSCK